MEAELLAGVIQTDTHKRLQIVDQLIEYFKKEVDFDEFPDFERLIGGLSSWLGSSNFKVAKNYSYCDRWNLWQIYTTTFIASRDTGAGAMPKCPCLLAYVGKYPFNS